MAGEAGEPIVWPPMNSVEKELLEKLVELETTATQLPNLSPKPSLLPLFTRIEELTRALPKNYDAGLLHFLHNKSYQKARHHLEGKLAEPGLCH